MRRGFVGAVIVALLVGVLWTACEPAPEPLESSSVDSGVEVPRPTRERRRTATPADVDQAVDVDEAPPEEPTPPPEALTITGTARWTDGTVPGTFSFELVPMGFRYHRDKVWGRIRVSGADGRFEAVIPEAGAYSVQAIKSDDRSVYAGQGVFDLGRHDMDLVLDGPTPLELRVLDAATREPVRQPLAWRLPDNEYGWWGGYSYPSAKRVQTAIASKPTETGTAGGALALLGGAAHDVWVVAAERYALEQFRRGDTVSWAGRSASPRESDFESRSGVHEVLLSPGGTLLVEINPREGIPGASAFLAGGDLPGAIPLSALRPGKSGHGPTTFRHVPAGPYSVVVKRGKRQGQGTVFGRGEAVVPAGGTGRLFVELDPSLDPDWVHATGSLEVGDGWRNNVDVEFRGVGATTDGLRFSGRVEGGGGPFEIGPMPPGRYTATVRQCWGWRETVEVKADGEPLTFVVPSPVTLEFRLLYDKDGTAIPRRMVRGVWASPDQGQPNNRQLRMDKARGVYVVQAAPSVVHVHVSAWGQAPTTVEISLGAAEGVRSTEIRLQAMGGVAIRVRMPEGVPAPDLTRFAVHHAETGQEWKHTPFLQNGSCRAEVPPGVWLVTIPDLVRGKHRVEVRPGETTGLELDADK